MTKHIMILALAGCAILASCVVRIDWPEHKIKVNLNVEKGAAPSVAKNILISVDAVAIKPCKKGPRGYGNPHASVEPQDNFDAAKFAQNMLSGAIYALQPSVAYAHGITTPTRIATHHVVSLVDGFPKTQIGTWTPDPGEYCSVELLIAAADPNAVGLDTFPTMNKKSVGVIMAQHPNAAYSTRTILRSVKFAQPLKLSNDGDGIDADFTVNIGLRAGLPNPSPPVTTSDATLDNDWLLKFQNALNVEVSQ